MVPSYRAMAWAPEQRGRLPSREKMPLLKYMSFIRPSIIFMLNIEAKSEETIKWRKTIVDIMNNI